MTTMMLWWVDPTWTSAGWYRLAVGCYIVIVIGWFASIISAFRSAIYAFAYKAEFRIIRAAAGVFYTPPQEVHYHYALELTRPLDSSDGCG